MDTPALRTVDSPRSSSSALEDLPLGTFIAAWRAFTGEPPAILLSTRSEMLALLVESVPAAPIEPLIPPRDAAAPDPGTPR